MSDLPPPPAPPPPERRLPGGPWLWSIGAGLLIAGIAIAVILVVGGSDEAKAQTVRFQQPVDVGPDPFIDKPADRKGKKKVDITPSSTEVGAGPFGGTGSDLVCDRDLLIRSLKARPDRLAAWAQVVGIEPTIKAVGNYIAHLHPVTLTRDTRVTNHSFVDGQGVSAFQSILAAGTAVLVDDYGNPVARCRCGNPLTKPVYIPEAICLACPPRYQPPPSCPYTETTIYRRRWYPDKYYSNARYDEIFIREFRSDCYSAYPDPPIVRITTIYNPKFRPRRPRTPIPDVTIVPTVAQPQQPSTNPAASWSPGSGPVCVAYTLSVSGFAPNKSLDFTLTRPDGVVESYPLATNSSGSGSYTFSPTADCANDVQGTYSGSVVDRSTGDSASASLPVSGVAGGGGTDNDSGDPTNGLNCDAPQSQLEFEQCRDAGQG